MTLHDAGQRNRVPVTHRGDHARKPVTAAEKVITHTGSVKWFDLSKSHGYIRPDTGGKDVYLHINHLADPSMQSPVRRQRVQYELDTNNPARPSARNVRPTK